MTTLDVSAAILDPAFLDAMTLTRFAQTVGSNGRATNTPTTTAIYGVITNDKGDMLDRLAGSAQVSGGITVHTMAFLSAGTDATEADIITWNGGAYTVATLADYSRFGPGFTEAQCSPVKLAGVAP